jgi:cephalosporin hydroxylase
MIGAFVYGLLVSLVVADVKEPDEGGRCMDLQRRLVTLRADMEELQAKIEEVKQQEIAACSVGATPGSSDEQRKLDTPGRLISSAFTKPLSAPYHRGAHKATGHTTHSVPCASHRFWHLRCRSRSGSVHRVHRLWGEATAGALHAHPVFKEGYDDVCASIHRRYNHLAELHADCRLHSTDSDYVVSIEGFIEDQHRTMNKQELWIATTVLLSTGASLGAGPFAFNETISGRVWANFRRTTLFSPVIHVILKTLEGERLASDSMVVPLASDDDEWGHQATLRTRLDTMGWWYRTAETWQRQSWMGVQVGKWAGDLISYQELMHQMQTRVVVEFGSWCGGAALWFASTLMSIAAQRTSYSREVQAPYHVLSVDINCCDRIYPEVLQHPNIELMKSDSKAAQVADRIRCLRAQFGGAFFFILDSAHDSAHVLGELKSLHPVVQPGDVVIVEDTYLGHQLWGPDAAGWVPLVPTAEDGGPYAAINEFLSTNGEYYQQEDWFDWKQGFSQSAGGFLRRIK